MLPRGKREEIAAKIKQGVSADKILDDIRDNIHGDTLQRHHLLDKKDILNIQQAYGISDVQRHANDQESKLACLREWEDLTNCKEKKLKMIILCKKKISSS